MTILLQHLLVLALVLACATFVVWQSLRTLRGKHGRVGSCCSKGCTPASNTAPAQRTLFLPLDSLKKR
jgi:hypothetical protein